MPFGLEVVAELLKFLGLLAGQHDGAGAETVTEGVEADGRFSLGSFGTARRCADWPRSA